ncbi:MAG: hypothetical protein BGO55_22950 [Sphingobacteriales bacterium 50-39]|nr:PD40 domain-containing protein [Sphingobacteriales bacterium]OJW58171.1 MAG: hypothetical protein BGO55_22950 [Sphingobacteriales bacterium 50-39]
MNQRTITLLLFAALLVQHATAQPRIFAEGVISTGDYETHPAFSPTGDTLYFLKGLPDAGFFSICVSYKKEGKWTIPQVAPFSGQYTDADPFVTRDGKMLYFVSNRPAKAGEPARSDWDIWKVEITANGWGKPIHLDSTINSSSSEYFPTLADNGNLYFGSGRKGGKGRSDIYVSRFIDGHYGPPENLGNSINTADNEYEPYIAPDESYLISATEWGGKVTRDGKYFFFGSSRNKIRDTLPQREDMKAFDHRLHSAGNGLGDIYYIEMKSLLSVSP